METFLTIRKNFAPGKDARHTVTLDPNEEMYMIYFESNLKNKIQVNQVEIEKYSPKNK